MASEPRYNPLDKLNLGVSVVNALLDRDVHPLGEIEPFEGPGSYTIYYSGDFPTYEAITCENRDGAFRLPIYVGKAVPPGARKGGLGLDPEAGTVLWTRLREHADTIRRAENLAIEDFHCRYILVDDIWIPLAESILIARYSPLWNKLIDGFGNHDPGSGRYNQLRSRWDTLHPGRPWATRCRERPETADQIAIEVKAHLGSLSLSDF